METNNLDLIRQAVLFTKQNNLIFKKVYSSGSTTTPYYAIKVISIDPNDALDTSGKPIPVDWDSLEQDKDYYVTTFLTNGAEEWTAWSLELSKKGWFILSATETRQKGTKDTSSIPEASAYNFKKEFLETEASQDRPRLRPFGFLENFAVPPGAGSTGGFFNALDRGILNLSNMGPRGFTTTNYESAVGTGNTYKGVDYDPANPKAFNRNYTATNSSSNLIQKHFSGLGVSEKITLGWSGGSFEDWWEDSYSSSATPEEGEFGSFQTVDNPAAVATFNQEVPMRANYKDPNFQAFYKDKKEEFLKNPDPKKGNFMISLPTEDEMLFYGLKLPTFYELGLEPTLTPKEVDSEIIAGLIGKISSQLYIRQNIDDIEDARKQARDRELERSQKTQKNIDTGTGILTNLFKRVDRL